MWRLAEIIAEKKHSDDFLTSFRWFSENFRKIFEKFFSAVFVLFCIC